MLEEINHEHTNGINHEHTNEIVCPWCGYESGDSWEYSENEGNEKCGDCDEKFNWQRDITIDYSTSKKI